MRRVAVLAGSIVVAGLAAVAAFAGGSSAVDLSAASAQRAEFGLDGSLETTQAIVSEGRDVGSQDYGIPMTAEERTEFEARQAFANYVGFQLIPYLESLSTYGGVYFDQLADGRLFVLLTENDPAVALEIEKRLAGAPRPNAGFEIREVALTRQTLIQAVHRVWELWPQLVPDAGPLPSASVDTVANRIELEVTTDQLPRTQSQADAMSEALGGIPVAIEVGDYAVSAACTDRDHCTPFRAGSRIRKGSSTGSICGMGWLVVVGGSDNQLLSAGHCGWSGSNDWYHQGYSTSNPFGSETATLLAPGGVDVMRINMPDSGYETSLVYGAGTGTFTVHRHAMLGETVCASRAYFQSNSCGMVTDDYDTWTETNCGCVVHGDDSSIPISGGDSGSPVYVPTGNIAIGVVNTTNGHYASLTEALTIWNISLRIP